MRKRKKRHQMKADRLIGPEAVLRHRLHATNRAIRKAVHALHDMARHNNRIWRRMCLQLSRQTWTLVGYAGEEPPFGGDGGPRRRQ